MEPGPRPGFLTLLLHRPPWLALGLTGAALLLSRAPDPVAADAAGVSPRVLALPVLGLAAAASLPAVLRALSQGRALRDGDWRKAKVTGVEVLTSGESLPRNRILWSDGDGRIGRSLVIRKRWVPPKGASIRVAQDPASARQWWEGDIPGTVPPAPSGATGTARAAPALAALSWPATWVAIMAGLCAVILGLSDAPALLVALPLIATAVALYFTLGQWRALSRALRIGVRIQGKVTGHFAAPVISVGRISRRGPRGASMRWETRQGHFGQTDYVAHARVIPIGQPIPLRVDPVTGVAFWEGIH
ncbi:MAG: hypothetical protein KDJ98_18900 [Rhodobacteraceae bacterium]|nr:hypothetical protein [Paracoccaceae bacterium]